MNKSRTSYTLTIKGFSVHRGENPKVDVFFKEDHLPPLPFNLPDQLAEFGYFIGCCMGHDPNLELEDPSSTLYSQCRYDIEQTFNEILANKFHPELPLKVIVVVDGNKVDFMPVRSIN